MVKKSPESPGFCIYCAGLAVRQLTHAKRPKNRTHLGQITAVEAERIATVWIVKLGQDAGLLLPHF